MRLKSQQIASFDVAMDIFEGYPHKEPFVNVNWIATKPEYSIRCAVFLKI